jgi:hypothetical protein
VGLMFAAAAACSILLLFRREPQTEILSVHSSMTAVVAICVSGAPRSIGVLEQFAASLLQHVVRQHRATFDAFLWMDDTAAEAQLQRLLSGDPGVRRCVTRSQAALLLGGQHAADEAASIARDHPASRYGLAWHAERSVNTLRMLHKLREVEALRVMTVARSGSGGAQGHSWVLRIRPDLELTAPLPLPPLEATAGTAARAYSPWVCESEQLSSDQLLLLPTDTMSRHNVEDGPLTRLSQLYEPMRLSEAMVRSAPPSLYPERLVWHALGADLQAWPGSAEGRLGLRLLGADGSPRDPYAKLRADFPRCFGAT